MAGSPSARCIPTQPNLRIRSTRSAWRVRNFALLRHRQSRVDNCLGFLLDAAQMFGSPEAFRVNLVNIFGPGRARREPAAGSGDFPPADGSSVSGRLGEHSLDWFPPQLGEVDLPRRELRQ